MLVVGEAISQLARTEVEVAEQIRDYRRIIAFRNRVVHLYQGVEPQIVYDILTQNRADITELLALLLDALRRRP